jgi:nicotinamidase-related amidase
MPVFLYFQCLELTQLDAPQEYFQISVLEDATRVLSFFYQGVP